MQHISGGMHRIFDLLDPDKAGFTSRGNSFMLSQCTLALQGLPPPSPSRSLTITSSPSSTRPTATSSILFRPLALIVSRRTDIIGLHTIYSQLLELLFNLLHPFSIAYLYYSFTPWFCAPRQAQLKASAFCVFQSYLTLHFDQGTCAFPNIALRAEAVNAVEVVEAVKAVEVKHSPLTNNVSVFLNV